jgi:aryl sulfotransferase
MRVTNAPRYPLRSKTRMTSRHDSTRWDHYSPRAGDTVVAAFPKCGTTWMEHIVLNLFHHGSAIPLIADVAPWVELRFRRGNQPGPELPAAELTQILARQTHRRQMKTHLPLDCLPYHPEVHYLIVGRDARDACMSAYNHDRGLGRIGEDTPMAEYWRAWITTIGDGRSYPEPGRAGAHPLFDYYQQWWDYRQLDNILFVDFADLKQDLTGEIRRVAAFLGVDAPEELLQTVRDATTFTSMKANAEQLLPHMTEFRGGAHTFIYKGTNGRWREALSEEDLQQYEPVAARSASPECRAWLEGGRTMVEP